jgi:hypothetical protein
MDDSFVRRKSPLLVSVTIGGLEDEDQEIGWPALSFSERSMKSARCAAGIEECCAAGSDFQIGSIVDSDDASRDGIDAELLKTCTLRKSGNFCSVVLKEDRGSESWRDFL